MHVMSMLKHSSVVEQFGKLVNCHLDLLTNEHFCNKEVREVSGPCREHLNLSTGVRALCFEF